MLHINKTFFVFITISITIFSCRAVRPAQGSSATPATTIDGHPSWIMQGNIYEVNVRQYTPEGTFKAFGEHVPRLKDMGVETLWFMPINPISREGRKGTLGSYYAVSDYTAVNPEFGTMRDWNDLVNKCHRMGFKVIIDWVPNHSGADNRWLRQHKNFYVLDKNGNPTYEFDWNDTRKLNYDNGELRDSMISAMKFWIDSSGIDGFRCDHTDGQPTAFWSTCIKQLKLDKKDILMLAESEDPRMHEAGFDMTYGWRAFHTMVDIAAAKQRPMNLDSIINYTDKNFPASALQLYFTSNHDENSWNKADYKTMPGAVHAPFAVLTQTLPRSVPLIYSGQEEPFLDSISFFYKDTITFGKYRRAEFYHTLLTLRISNAALAANAGYEKLKSSDDTAIFAFERKNGNRKVLVLVNLTDQPQSFTLQNADVAGGPKNVFADRTEQLKSNQQFNMQPWGYLIYSY
jgi:glycosidase